MTRAAAASIAAAFVFAIGPATAIAHDGELPLRVIEHEVRPGGTIEVIGDLSVAGPVELGLRTAEPASDRSLAVVDADDLGHFQVFVAVPLEVPAGEYLVVATNELGSSSVALTVAGAPIDPGEAGQLPGRDEALAGATAGEQGALPSVAEVTSPTPVAADELVDAGIDAVPLAAGAMAAFALVILATRTGRRRGAR